MDRYENQIVLVTGASRGIGASISRRFLNEGARVLIVSRSRPEYLEAPDWNGRACWCKTDVAKAGDVDAVFDYLDTEFGGRLDVLINNVGVQLDKTIDETSDEEWAWINSINMGGTFRFSRHAVRRMRKAGHGVIVNIGSIAGETADYGLPLYSASKGWVHAFTRAMATDHGRHGIRCNAVCPTWTMTEMSTMFFDSEPDPAAARQGIARRHPLGRLAEPEDIAGACAWLASPDAAFVNGQLITVDGGMGAASAVNPEFDLG